MRRHSFGFLMVAILLSASYVSAQGASEQVSVVRAQAEKDFSDHGLRVSLLFPNLNQTNQTEDSKKDQRLKYSFGVAVGTAYIPNEEIGATANLGLIELKTEENQSYLARIDANITYGFLRKFNIKTGINFSTAVFPTIEKSALAPGFQASLGYQMTKRFGIDLGYVYMKSTFSTDGDYTNQLTYSGFEVAMSSVF